MTVTTRVKATIHEDNTGKKSELPIILTDEGELSPLTDYLLKMEANGGSLSSINNVVRATQLLIEYMSANTGVFSDPKVLFQTFVKRMYSGTIGDDGLDPSGLYWIPPSTKTVDIYIKSLTGLTDFLTENTTAMNMNPIVEASPHQQRLNYAAWHRKNQNDFLGHIKDKSKNKTIRKVRLITGRTKSTATNDDAKAFPEHHFESFYNKGIGGAKDPRVMIRDKLILLLMHYGGLRESEALSLWACDVFEDPMDDNPDPDIPKKALVRIYHEEHGKAPHNWKSSKGAVTRQAYLKQEHGIIPRRQMMGTSRVGFKGKNFDHKDNYIQVQWFPADAGRAFMVLWQDYLKYRASVDCEHPFAFINFHPQYIGKPYKISAFLDNYETGLRRIGLEPNKSLGQDPHGHRHSYGRRLRRAKAHPLIIKRCMHHSRLESQEVYTGASQTEVNEALNKATLQLANPDSHIKSLDWKTLTEHGFEDIDPNGHFTGKHPKSGRK
jgi:integrase